MSKNSLSIIMLDCLKDNFASLKTITSLGGFLVKEEEKIFHDEKVIIQDYNINVDESLEKYKDIYKLYIVVKEDDNQNSKKMWQKWMKIKQHQMVDNEVTNSRKKYLNNKI